MGTNYDRISSSMDVSFCITKHARRLTSFGGQHNQICAVKLLFTLKVLGSTTSQEGIFLLCSALSRLDETSGDGSAFGGTRLMPLLHA